MARSISPQREQEYAELNAFLDFYSTHISKIDPADPIHPTNVGKLIVAEYGKSKALEGLRQAINDTIEDSQDLSPQAIQELDAALRSAGIISLIELRRRYSRKYKSIVRRGTIRNETEYYLIKGILDGCTEALDATEVDQLGTLLSAYEQRI